MSSKVTRKLKGLKNIESIRLEQREKEEKEHGFPDDETIRKTLDKEALEWANKHWDELDDDKKRTSNGDRWLKELHEKEAKEKADHEKHLTEAHQKKGEEIKEKVEIMVQEEVQKLLKEKAEAPPELAELYDQLIKATSEKIRAHELGKIPGISDNEWGNYNDAYDNAGRKIERIMDKIMKAMQEIRAKQAAPKPLQMPEKPIPEPEKVNEISSVPAVASGPEVHEESAPPDTIPQELEPPVETQITPVESKPEPVAVVAKVPENSTVPAVVTGSKVKNLVQLGAISESQMKEIIDELKNGIENPYYRLRGKGIAYKDNKMKKKAKNGNVFEEIITEAPKTRGRKPKITETAPPSVEEVPPPFSDVSAAPSISEVTAVEKEVKPAPIKKRTLNLMNEARKNDLTDKGFIGGGLDSNNPFFMEKEFASRWSKPPTLEGQQFGSRKLNLNNLNGTLDLGQNRLNLNIGGSF